MTDLSALLLDLVFGLLDRVTFQDVSLLDGVCLYEGETAFVARLDLIHFLLEGSQSCQPHVVKLDGVVSHDSVQTVLVDDTFFDGESVGSDGL